MDLTNLILNNKHFCIRLCTRAQQDTFFFFSSYSLRTTVHTKLLWSTLRTLHMIKATSSFEEMHFLRTISQYCSPSLVSLCKPTPGNPVNTSAGEEAREPLHLSVVSLQWLSVPSALSPAASRRGAANQLLGPERHSAWAGLALAPAFSCVVEVVRGGYITRRRITNGCLTTETLRLFFSSPLLSSSTGTRVLTWIG